MVQYWTWCHIQASSGRDVHASRTMLGHEYLAVGSTDVELMKDWLYYVPMKRQYSPHPTTPDVRAKGLAYTSTISTQNFRAQRPPTFRITLLATNHPHTETQKHTPSAHAQPRLYLAHATRHDRLVSPWARPPATARGPHDIHWRRRRQLSTRRRQPFPIYLRVQPPRSPLPSLWSCQFARSIRFCSVEETRSWWGGARTISYRRQEQCERLSQRWFQEGSTPRARLASAS